MPSAEPTAMPVWGFHVWHRVYDPSGNLIHEGRNFACAMRACQSATLAAFDLIKPKVSKPRWASNRIAVDTHGNHIYCEIKEIGVL